MDTGNFVQIVITVIGIIGAAAVALVCDMLKTNNERLRHVNLELQIRREEEQRRAEQALDHLKRIAPLASERGLLGPSARTATVDREVGVAQLGAGASQAGATLPEARMLAREFLETLKARQAAENGVHDGAAPERAAASAVSPSPQASEPARAPRKNWELLLKGAAHRTTIDVTPVPGGRQRGELIPFESLHTANYPQPEQDKLRLPSGFHGIGELSQLLELTKPLQGLVFSIALSGAAASETGSGIPSGTMRGAAAEWVRGMLEPGEFGCQSAIDQLLIVIAAPPQVSQHRLTEITEKLWDYQLRDDVTSRMTLSWGGYEASGEALSDAIRSAMQRMEENRRSRAAASPGSGPGRRRAM